MNHLELILKNKLVTVDISETRELKNLGTHPETGRPVTVRLTKYGPTIQMGTKEDEEKPKWAALTYEQKKILTLSPWMMPSGCLVYPKRLELSKKTMF